MMRNPSPRKYAILLLVLWPMLSFAQPKADSLLQLVHQLPSAEAQLSFLDSLAENTPMENLLELDSLIQLRVKIAEELAPGLDNVKRAVSAAEVLANIGESQVALDLLAPYYEQREAIDIPADKQALLRERASILTDRFESAEAIQTFEELLALYDKNYPASKEELAWAYLNLGKNQHEFGRYGESGVSLNKAKEYYESLRDSSGLKFTYNELGNLYGRIALYDEAIRQFRQMERFDQAPDPITIGFNAANIGRSYLEQRDIPAALAEYHKGLSVTPFPPGNEYVGFYLINGVAECHYFAQQADSVRFYLQRLEQEMEGSPDADFFGFLLRQVRFFDAALQRDFQQAEGYLTNLYEEAEAEGNDAALIAYAGYFAELYRNWGRYEEALNYQDIYTAWSDSVRTANKTHALVVYQTAYETKEKEQAIQQLEADKELQQLRVRQLRSWFLFGGIGLALLFGLIVLRQYYRNKMEQAARVQQLRNKISRDLHDDVGSMLTGLAMRSELIAAQETEAKRDPLQELANMSRSAMSRMRDLVWIMDDKRDN